MITIEYKLTGIEALTRSQVINAVKRALVRMGEAWVDSFAAKRFEETAYAEYGFKPRSKHYVKRKHHNRPLFFTGETRDELLDSTKPRIKATRDTVRIPMPTKINRYNPKGPNLPDEIRKVTPAELVELRKVLVAAINEELDAEVPAAMRSRGYIGGRVQSLRLRGFRGTVPASQPPGQKAA